MRDIDDLQNAFGQADNGFKNRVYLTLAGLQKSREKIIMKKLSFRVALAIVVACIMVTGTALALSNTWGILDFLSGRTNAAVLPEAEQLVQTDVAQQGEQAELVTFTVREAVYDGKGIFIVVDAKPSSSEYMLLGADTYPTDNISDMGPLWSNTTGTIADYASENGKTMLRAWANAKDWDWGATSIDFVLQEDGTLTYMLSGSYEGNEVEQAMNLECGFAPYTEKDGKTFVDTKDMTKTMLSITLENNADKSVRTNAAPAEYTDCGVRVDKITLTGSPMAIYAKIEFTVIDEEKFAATDGGLWFEFVDENGERLPMGASAGGGSYAADESGTRFIQEDSLQAAEVLPSQIILRGYNCWEKNRYETHTFEMK